MISFKAKYINSQYIDSIHRKSKKPDYKVSFVELNPLSSQDVNTVQDVATSWENNSSLATPLCDTFLDCNLIQCNDDRHFFALTIQRENFKNLLPQEVLGLAQISLKKDNKISLDFLQVDPDNIYSAPERNFKGIGKILVKAILDCYSTKDVTLSSTFSAYDFYKKLGFKQIRQSSEFILKR